MKRQDNCACTYKGCTRHGDCKACVAYHRQKGEVPGCFFSVDGEKTYNRSIEALYRDYTRTNR